MKKEINNIIYEINKDVELISIIELFTDFYKENPKFLTTYDFEYIRKIKKYFIKYKNHSIIKLFDKLFKKGFVFQLPFQYTITKNKEEVIYGKLNVEDLKEFDNELNNFRTISNFDKFYEENKSYLNDIFIKNINMIKDYNIHSVINLYFNTNYPKFGVIFSPQLLRGGYGLNINGILTSLIGPYEVKDFPIFCDKKFLTDLIIHEIVHTYVEKVIEANKKLIEKNSNIILKDRKESQISTYSTSISYFEEVLVRSITLDIILNSNIFNEEEFNEIYKENTESYPLVTKMLNELKNNNKDITKSISNILKDLDNKDM